MCSVIMLTRAKLETNKVIVGLLKLNSTDLKRGGWVRSISMIIY